MALPRLSEYFHVNDAPIKPLEHGPAVRVRKRWTRISGVGLTKTYEIPDRPTRDAFVVRCVALETHVNKQDVVWTIEGPSVTVLMKEAGTGLTQTMVEFARELDSLREDLDLAQPPAVVDDVG